MTSSTIPEVDEEVAFHFIVRCLREKYQPPYSNYGYELYVPNVIYHYLKTVGGLEDPSRTADAQRLSPPFYSAAWEMARRGILRPGVQAMRSQTTDEGSGGGGFSITSAGRRWLQESGQYEFVPIEPGRFSRQLATFAPKFGDGFAERSQEAIRCYGANAYLACCSMCGAAAESIVLAVASARTSIEKTEKEYLGSGGRGRIEKLILGQQPEAIRSEFRGYMSLLKYWRDAASHGHRQGIGDNEAYTALAVLLRFAQFATDRWDELTVA